MKYLSSQLEEAIKAIREMDKEEAVEAVANIFMEVELEMGYLDTRRIDAEDAFNFWLDAQMNLQKENEIEKQNADIENYINTHE
jgi:hypothetical protein